MIINSNNGNILNTKDFYIHDDIFYSLEFKYDCKTIVLKMKKYMADKNYNIVFNNVLGFEMSNCDFWGKSECVFDLQYIKQEKYQLIPKLESKWRKESESLDDIFINSIEILITFTSGNELRIVCDSIEV